MKERVSCDGVGRADGGGDAKEIKEMRKNVYVLGDGEGEGIRSGK